MKIKYGQHKKSTDSKKKFKLKFLEPTKVENFVFFNLHVSNHRRLNKQTIGDTKRSTPIGVLCQGHPDEFAKYLKYVRGLDFFDKPDYEKYRKMFQDLLKTKGWDCDWQFDWFGKHLVS